MKISEEKKDFFEQVYQVVVLIPFGRVTSYGAIAKYLGSAKSSRMVGWALNASHRIENIPAHRVVNRVGLLSGKNHFSTHNTMQEKLEIEGLIIKDNQIVNFEKHFWDPMLELAL